MERPSHSNEKAELIGLKRAFERVNDPRVWGTERMEGTLNFANIALSHLNEDARDIAVAYGAFLEGWTNMHASISGEPANLSLEQKILKRALSNSIGNGVARLFNQGEPMTLGRIQRAFQDFREAVADAYATDPDEL